MRWLFELEWRGQRAATRGARRAARKRGISSAGASFLAAVLATSLCYVGCSSADAGAPRASECPSESPLRYENFGRAFFLSWCTGCHSSELSENSRQGAPPSIHFDDLASIRAHDKRIIELAVHNRAMPPAGGPSEEQRKLLDEWLACGAPGEAKSFDPAPSRPVYDPPMGECAKRREPLPDSVLPRCSAKTQACVQSCSGAEAESCRNACLAADSTPPTVIAGSYPVNCANCTILQLFACGEARGCHDPLAEALCCNDAECPPGSPEGCGDQRCASEFRALGLCLGYAAEECLSYVTGDMSRCFTQGGTAL